MEKKFHGISLELLFSAKVWLSLIVLPSGTINYSSVLAKTGRVSGRVLLLTEEET